MPFTLHKSLDTPTERSKTLMRKHAGSKPQAAREPIIENRKVPRRQANAAYRSREYLSDKEVTAPMKAAGRVGRHCGRDSALIPIAYRHGLRVSELVGLRWDQADLQQSLLHVARRKHGIPPSIPCADRSCVSCAGYNGTTRPLPTYFSANGRRRSPPMQCARPSAGPGVKPASSSKSIRTCCAMPPVTSWPTTDKIRGPFSTELAPDRSKNFWRD